MWREGIKVRCLIPSHYTAAINLLSPDHGLRLRVQIHHSALNVHTIRYITVLSIEIVDLWSNKNPYSSTLEHTVLQDHLNYTTALESWNLRGKTVSWEPLVTYLCPRQKKNALPNIHLKYDVIREWGERVELYCYEYISKGCCLQHRQAEMKVSSWRSWGYW